MAVGPRMAWSAGFAALVFIAWMSFVGNFSSQEFLLGGGCALLTTAFCLLTWSAMALPVRARAADFLPLLRAPWDVARDSWIVIAALAKDLAGIARTQSLVCAAAFERSKDERGKDKRSKDERGFMRRVLAVAFTTISPNSIVIGIDETQGQMIYHQIVRSGVPAIAKRLGAKG